RYWYTYRIFVAVLLGIVVSGSMFWLYTQQVYGDAQPGKAILDVSVHPEDRLMAAGGASTEPSIEIVGIDDRSVTSWPLKRDEYATVLQKLEAAGAAVVAFDVGFHVSSGPAGDVALAQALMDRAITE